MMPVQIKTCKYEKVAKKSRLTNGGMIYKSEEATNFRVNERTIQRNIDDIMNYFEKEAVNQVIVNGIINVCVREFRCSC